MRSSIQHKTDLTNLYPTIQISPLMALKSSRMAIDSSARLSGPFVQSAALLHLEYGKLLEPKLMACDPFYAVHELFLFSAFSEVQFLNMIATKLQHSPGHDLTSLLYTQEVLDAHTDRLRLNLQTIKSRGGPAWSALYAQVSMQESALAAAQSLQDDYEHLIQRSERLSARCKDKMNILMNKAIVDESNKAIEESREITKLTRLAFIFIPIGFTSSFFGMMLRSELIEAI